MLKPLLPLEFLAVCDVDLDAALNEGDDLDVLDRTGLDPIDEGDDLDVLDRTGLDPMD